MLNLLSSHLLILTNQQLYQLLRLSIPKYFHRLLTAALWLKSLLQPSSVKAAKLWQFASTLGAVRERKARLIFEYLIVPKGTSESELQPVYMPPYIIKVKRLKERYKIAW
jgi:hypothetical protein